VTTAALSCDCCLHCSACKCFPHMYRRSCVDYEVHATVCKHAHTIHSLITPPNEVFVLSVVLASPLLVASLYFIVYCSVHVHINEYTWQLKHMCRNFHTQFGLQVCHLCNFQVPHIGWHHKKSRRHSYTFSQR
jgi:hypothetical protein